MGKLVTFWSPYAGHGKVTASLCAVLGGFILQYPELSLAISHSQNEFMPLLTKLDSKAFVFENNGWLTSYGVEALKIYTGQNMISQETTRRCGIPLLGQVAYFYPNIVRNGKEDNGSFQILTDILKKEFDIIFFDLKSGNPEEAFRYMQVSDVVIVLLPQDPFYVEKFLREEAERLNTVEYGVVFGGCFPKSQYKSSYYKKLGGKKLNDKVLGEILWNCEFFNAMSEGKALDYFFRNGTLLKNEENYEFIFQVKKTAERIRNKIINS